MRLWVGALALVFAAGITSYAQAPRKLVTVTTTAPIRSVSTCGSSGLVAALGSDGSVEVWRLASGEVVTKRPPETGLGALACSPDGNWLAIGRRDGTVVIADMSGRTAQNLNVAHQRIARLAFSPDASLLAVGVHQSPAQLWDPAKGTRVAVLDTNFSGSEGIDFSPDSSLLATADADTAIRIYDRNGKLRAKYTGSLLEPFALSFLPDGKQLVVGGADCTLTLLDTSHAHVVRALPKQPDPVFRIAALPDGNSLISLHIDAASLKRFTTLHWDLRSGAKRELPIDGRRLVGFGKTAGREAVLFTADSDSSLTAWVLAD